MKVLYVADSNLKHLKDVPNLITLENYMEQKLFIKMCTAFYLQTAPKYRVLNQIVNSGNGESVLKGINSKIGELLHEYRQYLRTEYNSNLRKGNAFFDSIYAHVLENKLLDYSIIDKVDYLSDYLEDIPMLSLIDWHRVEITDLANAIYRFNKSVPVNKMKKMNPNYYVNLNESELSWLSDKERELYTNCRI